MTATHLRSPLLAMLHRYSSFFAAFTLVHSRRSLLQSFAASCNPSLYSQLYIYCSSHSFVSTHNLLLLFAIVRLYSPFVVALPLLTILRYHSPYLGVTDSNYRLPSSPAIRCRLLPSMLLPIHHFPVILSRYSLSFTAHYPSLLLTDSCHPSLLLANLCSFLPLTVLRC